MNSLLPYSLLIATMFAVASCSNQSRLSGNTANGPALDLSREFTSAASKYKLLAWSLPPDRFPRNYDPKAGKLNTSDAEWWCSGFYPATLLYIYEQTRDTALYHQALRIMQVLEGEKYNTGTHDLGFMMYCPFGKANAIAPRPEYNEILMTSARSLASRFDPVVGCIRSWNSNPSDFIVIIDNMMNLELLFWATRHSGDSLFHKIAVTHANTTMDNHFRPDNSSFHVLNYDRTTGEVKEKKTAQGYADASAWARGQAWGLYGYVLTYRETKDAKYLEQARKIADFWLNHPNLPADKIPYWDFNAPNIPGAQRDASAGAITASALLELSTFVQGEDKSRYFNTAETMIKALSAAPYKAAPGTNGGFILQHSVGHLPANSEVDVAITYADYYYIEALSRYKQLKQ